MWTCNLLLSLIALYCNSGCLSDSTTTRFLTARVGESVVLPCVTTLDQPVDWTYRNSSHDDAVLQEVARAGVAINGWINKARVLSDRTGEYSLVIIRQQVGDSGLYDCIENSGLGTHNVFNLTVFGALQQPSYATPVGKPIMLPCYSTVDKPVYWYFKSSTGQQYELVRDSVAINGWRNRIHVVSGEAREHSLVIVKPEVTDSGLYTCAEDSGIGNIKHYIQLNVSMNSSGAAAKAFAEMSVAFSCEVHNTTATRWHFLPQDGTAEPVLLYNGRDFVDHSGKFKIYNVHGRLLTILLITRVQASDAGTYFCSPADTAIRKQIYRLVSVLPDTDECQFGNNGGCHIDATCVNLPGSFACICKTGFNGDGKTRCQDIDECLTDNGGCHKTAADCINIKGSRICQCRTGYHGDGVICTGVTGPDSDKTAGLFTGYVIAVVVISVLLALALVIVLLLFVYWRSRHCADTSGRSVNRNELNEEETSFVRPTRAPAGSQSSSDITENNNTPTVSPTFEYLSQSIESGSAVCGLCVAGDVLYVARDNQSTVDVFNRQTMNKTGSLQVSDDIHPTCMAIDKKSKICLYISYEVSKMIRKVEVQSGIVTQWQTSSEPDGVAVIPESSNVIVALKIIHKLTEYKSTVHGATIIREFNLANDLFPRFVTPFSANQFVICYGEPGKKKCGVALVDTSSGLHVKRFETKSTCATCAVVGADGFVFVADSSAETVALFRNVNYVNDVIHAIDGVKSPSRLCFGDNSETLYVAESTGDCRVLAYKRTWKRITSDCTL